MSKRIGLPVEAWPIADRLAWAQAIDSADFFADNAGAAHWRPKTRRQACYAYARWLAHVNDQWPDALQMAPQDRVDPHRIQVYIDELAGRLAPMSIAAELQHLLLALRALAPYQEWAWLGKLQYHWQRRAQPRDQRHKVVDPRRLLDLGRALISTADDNASPVARARQFRDGLLIALLVLVPLRRRSVTALRVDQHVRRVGESFHIVLEPDDTKAGHAVEFEVPPAFTADISRYLTYYRPLFPRAKAETALWLSSKGGALRAEAIYDLVCRRTEAAFGFSIHPHLFRTIAATAIAREAPERIAMARDLLTHAKLDTTLRHYTQAQTVQAARSHGALIASLRAGTARAGHTAGGVPTEQYVTVDVIPLAEGHSRRKP